VKFSVEVKKATVLPSRELSVERRRELDFEFELGCDTPGKAQRKARELFNKRRVSNGKGTLVCISCGCHDGVITLICDTDLTISAREEESRLTAGGVRRRAVPVSRHSR